MYLLCKHIIFHTSAFVNRKDKINNRNENMMFNLIQKKWGLRKRMGIVTIYLVGRCCFGVTGKRASRNRERRLAAPDFLINPLPKQCDGQRGGEHVGYRLREEHSRVA